MTPQQSPSHLPSLPQALVHILDAVHSEEMSFQKLAEIIHQDPAITARLLAVANSTSHAPAHRCQTVERALLVLGIDTVKTIVITVAIRQFFNSFGRNHQGFLKAFWQRSLTIASLAQRLAQLTGYRSPDQAYLTGLLTDLGQLVLLQQHGQHYLEQHQSATNDQALLVAEQAAFDATHCTIGASLVQRWQIDPVMATALAQHHDEVAQITSAHPLVQIINLASLLSLPEQGVQQAGLLFDFSEELVEDLRARAQQQVLQLAQALEIDTDTSSAQSSQDGYEQLGQRLSQIWEQEETRAELSRAQDQTQLHLAVQRVASLMTGVEQPLLFLLDAAESGLKLAGAGPAALAEQALPHNPGHSSISDALLQQRMVISGTGGAGRRSAVDQELRRQLDKEQLLCLPLLHETQGLGVLVLGLNGPLPMQTELLEMLGREIARALANRSTAESSPAAQLQQRIDEAVHEASNPLSIIGNYLEILRLKLREGRPPADDIALIQEEMHRVGNILLRLKMPLQNAEGDEALAVNSLIERLARILENSLFAARHLKLDLRLDPTDPIVLAPAGPIKQILINLLKNAAEALPEGGSVVVSTTANTQTDDGLFTAISVEDNGPGIPSEVMNQLFSAVASTKGEAHQGLGLSITKRLVDDLSGQITCESGPWGTRFQVLIPQ